MRSLLLSLDDCCQVRSAKVSVVLPTMNEAKNVEPLCERMRDLRKSYSCLTEAIFSINNTTDDTDLILGNLSKSNEYGFVRVIHTVGARGSAIRKGVEAARGDIVVVMDSDGQYDPFEIPKLVHPITDQGYYMSVGRNHASASILRRLISEGFKKFTKILLGVEYVQTGFKAGLRSVLLDTIPEDAPGLDIDVRWMNNVVTKGYRDKLSNDFDVSVRPRLHGKTTFSPIKLALGLLCTIVVLFIERKTKRRLLIPRILAKLTLYPNR